MLCVLVWVGNVSVLCVHYEVEKQLIIRDLLVPGLFFLIFVYIPSDVCYLIIGRSREPERRKRNLRDLVCLCSTGNTLSFPFVS